MKSPRRPRPGPVVRVLGWDFNYAAATVDGVPVRVGRTPHGARWRCDEHGTRYRPHCGHLKALAASPAPPEMRRAARPPEMDETGTTPTQRKATNP